jgi:hypothetical protein
MDLAAVYAEIEGKLSVVSGLRVVKWSEKPPVPSATLLLPASIERGSYRGHWTVRDAQLMLLVGRANARSALKALFDLATAARIAVDPQAWTTCADVTVTETTIATIGFAGAPDAYLGALLHLDITGTGA